MTPVGKVLEVACFQAHFVYDGCTKYACAIAPAVLRGNRSTFPPRLDGLQALRNGLQ